MRKTPKDYEQAYIDICLKALSENRVKTPTSDYEEHHIQPITCGGLDNSENLVLVTPKEHFALHACLVEFLEDDELLSMSYALNMIHNTRKKNPDKYSNEKIHKKNKKRLSTLRAKKALEKKDKQ